MALNQVILQGRISTDLSTEYTQSGKAYLNFNLAVKRDKENTDFINCIAWNATAENIYKFCDKGSSIEVVGTIRQETWETDGKKNSRLRVLVERIYFIDTKKSENNNEINTNKAQAKPNSNNVAADEDIDDFPF